VTDALTAAIASGDDARIRDAVRAAADDLREGRGALDPIETAEVVSTLVTHPSSRVRQAVAEACEILVDAYAEPALAILVEDTDHYVKTAARRSLDRRGSRKKTKAKDDDSRRTVEASLADMEKKFGRPARRLAERIAQRETEYFVRLLRHELVKIATPLEFSVGEIRRALDAPQINREALKKHAAITTERLKHVYAVIESARAYTTEVASDFRDESLASLVDEAAGRITDTLGARAKALAITNDIDPSVTAALHAPSMLQAILNVLHNAVEAYPAHASTLEIRASARTLRAGSQVALEIADHASGMTDSVRDHLFEPFGSVKPGGTGLGLLVVRKVVERVHGGTLALSSVPGSGTTVTMTLPTTQSKRAR
jgi:signal transduction histidine kinase